MAICFINNRNDRLQNNLDQHRAETERRAVEDHVDMGGLNPFARKDCRPRHMWHMESCHETVRAKELKKRAAAEAARDGLKKAKTVRLIFYFLRLVRRDSLYVSNLVRLPVC